MKQQSFLCLDSHISTIGLPDKDPKTSKHLVRRYLGSKNHTPTHPQTSPKSVGMTGFLDACPGAGRRRPFFFPINPNGTRLQTLPKEKRSNITLPETNSSHLKIGNPKMKVVFQPSIFRCYVGEGYYPFSQNHGGNGKSA